jgi:hypothetical protein
MLGPALTHLLQTVGKISETERTEDQQAIYRELRLLSEMLPAATFKESYAKMAGASAPHVVIAGDAGLYTTKPYKPPSTHTCSCCGQSIQAR